MAKVKFRHHTEMRIPARDGQPERFKLTGTTEDGELLERFNDWPEGVWLPIVAPDATGSDDATGDPQPGGA